MTRPSLQHNRRAPGAVAWFRDGDPWIWLTAAAVAASVLMVGGLLLLVAMRGLGHFWPAAVAEVAYTDPATGNTMVVVGQLREREEVSRARLEESGINLPAGTGLVTRHLMKTGNRDVLGLDFRWLPEPFMAAIHYPRDLVVMERREWGDLYGRLVGVKSDGAVVAWGDGAWPVLEERLAGAVALHGRIQAIEKGDIGSINYAMERLRLAARALELEGGQDPAAHAALEQEQARLDEEYAVLREDLGDLYGDIGRDMAVMEVMGGRQVEVPLAKVVRAYRPNAMDTGDKLAMYGARLWEFVSDDPREANTEGGIFPAIFGTVMMVIIMAVLVTPFGVVAAVYLREYAHQGTLTRIIRIAVNNLAGVPSIVYGVFGLGFFVYFLGGRLDELFFPAALPAPTFGTPGIFWASLTLALLTLPVVIVATEEGLARIPRSIREGSLALGATKSETLWRTVLPMASPAMMTGLILAVARAAGEVAPLMLVGVVKLAPSLPMDGNFPFLHLDRKFMHLGFHIYDVGFQSPNVEAARPLVYATALLLVVVILVLNLSAIAIRNRLRERYKSLES